MRPRILGLCLLLSCTGTTGSSSQRFIQTNRNLSLTVPEEISKGDLFFWRFNITKNILRLSGDTDTTFGNFKGRVDFFKQNLSLILKNVQLSDSGIYTAVVSRDEEEKVATYDVTVQAPVSPVLLDVVSASNTSESCNFTVSCTTKDSYISRSFSCDRHTCEKPRPLTPDPAPSLHLYLSDVSIICNHSNHVSWRNDTKGIRQVCPVFGSEDPRETAKSTDVNLRVGVGVGVGVAVFWVAFVAGLVLWKKQKGQRIMQDNTVYEVAERSSPRPAPGTDIALTESPHTIYSEVQPHTGPTPAPAPAPAPAQGPPESVYATVNKPKPPSPSLSAA